MNREERLKYYQELEQYAREEKGELALIKGETFIVYFPYREGDKYTKYTANANFQESLNNATTYADLTEI